MKLTHTRLLVANFPACFRFYRDTFGLTVEFGDENGPYASFRAGNTILALFDRHAMAEAVGTMEQPAEVAAQDRVALIFEVEDVDTVAAELERNGASLVTRPRDRSGWGIRTAHLRDPAGTLIELYRDLAPGS